VSGAGARHFLETHQWARRDCRYVGGRRRDIVVHDVEYFGSQLYDFGHHQRCRRHLWRGGEFCDYPRRKLDDPSASPRNDRAGGIAAPTRLAGASAGSPFPSLHGLYNPLTRISHRSCTRLTLLWYIRSCFPFFRLLPFIRSPSIVYITTRRWAHVQKDFGAPRWLAVGGSRLAPCQSDRASRTRRVDFAARGS